MTDRCLTLVFLGRYEAKILEYGGIELFLGGIGPDGHIAFNEVTQERGRETNQCGCTRTPRPV